MNAYDTVDTPARVPAGEGASDREERSRERYPAGVGAVHTLEERVAIRRRLQALDLQPEAAPASR